MSGKQKGLLVLALLGVIASLFLFVEQDKEIAGLMERDAELQRRVEILEERADSFTPAPVRTIAYVAELPAEEPTEEEPPADDWQTMDVVVTAYCPCEKCCGKWADGITATGTRATAGRTCAVDPATLPLGAQIELDGKIYVAEDTGVYGAAIDLFFDTHAEALAWGVQHKTVRWTP